LQEAFLWACGPAVFKNNSSALPGGVFGAGPAARALFALPGGVIAGPAARLFPKTILLPLRAGFLVLGLRPGRCLPSRAGLLLGLRPGCFPLRGGSRFRLPASHFFV